ncbi:unnamed protein product [Angiostrongylus costaricensis]|uniref:F-box domain-containing protein n=1 Tax=Angiostrongylus costaricensis TaxID=334426 RepID=A0A0R3PB38_ANGCS|nr:unnamed protein product [Angiostrongylus costaricensis]
MDTLNKDCLSQIFLNLDFTERVRLEHVCRMFHYVLQQQSTFSDTVILDISQFLINTSTDYYQQRHFVKDSLSFLPTVVGVITRCGSYVEQLSFGQRWLRISQPIIDCIANNCNRLSVVDFGAVILDADLSPILDRMAPQLQEFSLEETSWVNIEYAEKVKRIHFCDQLMNFNKSRTIKCLCHNTLWQITRVQEYFKYMKRLRKLNLRSAMFRLTKLNDLPTTLEYLEIGGAHSFPSEVLVQFLENHEQLEQLHASPVPVLDQDIISAISSMKNLRHLSLGHSYNTNLQFNELCNLTKLENLHLNEIVVVLEQEHKMILPFQNIHGLNDTSLRVILSRVQNIEQISLINCKNILDYTALGCCVQLHSLEIRNTMQLANEDIYELCTYGNLKRLILSNCFNFSSRGVNIALMRCQLKEVCAIMAIYLLPLRPKSR